MIKTLIRRWQSLRYIRYFVTVDPSDNSITLSPRLYRHIRKLVEASDATKVLLFMVPALDSYGFAINPEVDSETYLSNIQYNSKYDCVGFETLCPTVGKILFDYGLPADKVIKIRVIPTMTADLKLYYLIQRPRK